MTNRRFPRGTRVSLGLTFSFLLFPCYLASAASPADPPGIRVTETEDYVQVDTDMFQARIAKRGYVSGVARNTFLDKKTGARDIGFGLHIMDFLMAPGWRDDGYTRNPKLHGKTLAKHYVEGPQICTQAKKLDPKIVRGKDSVSIHLKFRFTKPAKGFEAGSLWEQTLTFRAGQRYFRSAEKITSANTVKDLFYRIDMPGHLRHKKGDNFTQVYLSYRDKPIPASAFLEDFGPDEKYLYQRNDKAVPKRMIRAYQVKLDGKPGPWLAGMTLDPSDVSEAWCHQRGYICFIQELHQRDVKKGETFGSDYIVGWFDDIAQMRAVYDRHSLRSKGDRE